MKSKKKTAPFGRKKFLLPPLFLFVLARPAMAQQQTVQPVVPSVEPISQLNMTNEFQVFPQNPAPTAPTLYEPFSWDQFVARPHVDYQFIEARGILAAPGVPVNTSIQNISPGILLNLGPHWSLDYTASLVFYSNHLFGNEFYNSINLTGQTVYGDWIFGFVQSIVTTSVPQVATAEQTSEQIYSTAVTGHHEDNQYISEDLGLYQNIQEVAGDFENIRSWSTLDWLNYQPQSRFNIGIGPGLGYDNADFGPDSVYEQAQGRLNWRATDKISFQLTGGIQETEFLGDTGRGDLFSPIYGGTIQYQPFTSTEISLYANRVVSPSYFVGQYAEETSFGASFNQRFFGQVYLSLNGGYNDQKYVASDAFVSANRTDHFYSFSVRLSHSLLKRGNVAIFYQYNSDESTVAEYTYYSNQYGVEVNYSF
jgi:hypothetical protein